MRVSVAWGIRWRCRRGSPARVASRGRASTARWRRRGRASLTWVACGSAGRSGNARPPKPPSPNGGNRPRRGADNGSPSSFGKLGSRLVFPPCRSRWSSPKGAERYANGQAAEDVGSRADHRGQPAEGRVRREPVGRAGEGQPHPQAVGVDRPPHQRGSEPRPLAHARPARGGVPLSGAGGQVPEGGRGG